MANGKNAEWAGRFCDHIGGKKVGLAIGICDKNKHYRKSMHKAARRKARQEAAAQAEEVLRLKEEQKEAALIMEELREFGELVLALNEPFYFGL